MRFYLDTFALHSFDFYKQGAYLWGSLPTFKAHKMAAV